MENNQENNKNTTPQGKFNFNSYWIYGIIILIILGTNIFLELETQTEKIDFNAFEEKVKSGEVDKVEIINKEFVNVYIKKEVLDVKYPKLKDKKFSAQQPQFSFRIGDIGNFERNLKEFKDAGYPVTYAMKQETNYIGQIISWILPFALLIGLWLFIMKRVSGGPGGAGGQIFNIGKSKATLFDSNSKVNVTFADVAGLNEAKVEVMEVVDFLKNPKKYTSLGGKIPKGVLLVGPPGTGKTLLAKAVAGEAGVPFFSISGSDFVEMFVGVGASRVRDLFKQAREKAPCIVFIDEIDAIGRARGRNAIQGGNDERENTLNQLLVEMDGFSTDKGVIMMAATNRPDILDTALLRPGRFDRQIGIDPPDILGREEIFKVHLRAIKVSAEIDPVVLAEMTPGFAGADIANICNEAALIAARRNKTEVDLDDFNYALDRLIGGLEKKNKVISPKEKEIIAYHEAGHAICGWYLEHASPLVKVTIVPRGIGTLGYAQYLPKEEYIIRTEQLQDRMCMTLGGRAAEKIVFDKISTGAQNDLDQVTKMAYGMVTIYGMNSNVGNVSYYAMSQDQFNKPYSEETARMIDAEVRKLIDDQYVRAKALLQEKRHELNLLATTLLEKEVLLKSDVERLIGVRPAPIDELAMPLFVSMKI
ncbi:MAG: ATP-dependent zinc metalloprotease FtsH [Saprospiraceae bacterium]|nr:ATP-dependent zinc metalloprotease FtsH [Saprospiraceae bacterium]